MRLGFFGGVPTVTGAPTPPPSQSGIFGINFDAQGGATLSGAGMPTFQDRVKEARGFTTTTSPWSNPVSINGSGWPTVDFLCLLCEGATSPSWMLGTYKCGFTGTGTPSSFGGCTVTVTSTAGGRTDFDLVATSFPFGFEVTGTSGGVTNIFAYLPGYGSSTIVGGRYTYSSTNLFTTEFANFYGQMGWIRWMDASNARFNTTVMTSSNRNTSANQKTNKAGATSNAADGYALNWMVDASNFANVGCYYTVALNYDATYLPAVASDMAQMTPGITNYVEPGNELWNFSGGVGGTDYQTTVNSYNSAHPGVLNYDSTSDQNLLNARYLAVWVHDISSAMQTAFGARYGTDIKVVAMWQTGTNGHFILSEMLKFLIHQYGSVSPYLHCIGLAPYMYRDCTNVPGDGVNHQGTQGTIAQIQSQLASQATWNPFFDNIENITVMAIKNGLQMMTYEGGQEVFGESGVTNMGAAIQDSGMATVVANYLAGEYSAGVSLFTWLASGVDITNTQLSPGYNMGVSFPISTSNSPRLLGFQNSLQNNITYGRNVITGSGTVIDGKNCADYGWNGSTFQFRLTPPTLAGDASNFAPYRGTSGYVPYLVHRQSATGNFTVVVNFTNSGSAVTTSFECNGTVLGTGINIPSGTNNVTMPVCALRIGPNYVLLGNGVSQSGVTINSLTFN